MSKLMQTPSQTVGPYFAYGLTPEQYRYDFNSWTTSDMISELGSRISGTSEIQNPNSEIEWPTFGVALALNLRFPIESAKVGILL